MSCLASSVQYYVVPSISLTPVLPLAISNALTEHPKCDCLQRVESSHRYEQVLFTASDGTDITSYRLAALSAKGMVDPDCRSNHG